jgi:predicted P-loop ATPase
MARRITGEPAGPVVTLSAEELEHVRRDQERATDEAFRLRAEEYPGSKEARDDNQRLRRLADSSKVDWKSLLRTRGGRITGDEANVLQALRAAPELVGLVRFNEFGCRTEFATSPPWRTATIGSEWTDADDVDLQAWLQIRGLEVKARGTIADCVSRVARDRPHHPVRDYLEWCAEVYDGLHRLSHWLPDYMGAEGPEAYLAAIGPAFLISAVARVMRPGCQADHSLVLEMRQGGGKTSAVRALGRPWITEGLPDLANKDAALHLAGVWIVELSELAAVRRTDSIEHVKAFLTRNVDRYRPPYGRRTVDVPRQNVFIGTTNEAAYLRDPTGNRRFWPVRCTAIDLPALELDRDQLWGEAVHRYLAGEAWHLAPETAALAAAEQDARRYVSELEQDVSDYLERMAVQGNTELAVRDVLRDVLGINSTDDPRAAAAVGAQVAAAMNRAGWDRVHRTGSGSKRRTVYRLRDTPCQE